jgi:hypothetical protein
MTAQNGTRLLSSRRKKVVRNAEASDLVKKKKEKEKNWVRKKN